MEQKSLFCDHCGLPNAGGTIRSRGLSFCCYGCLLANRITGQTGEEGESMWLLARLGISFFFTMNVVLLSVSDYLYPFEENVITSINFVKTGLATPVMFLLGIPILRNSLRSLASYRLDLDSLIILGTFSAFIISVDSTFRHETDVYYDTAVMILVLVTLGRYLEANSRVNASSMLKKFLELEPDEALVVWNGVETSVSAKAVKKGDIVKVLPGGKFPVDGVVTKGESTVDESMLTGESKPLYKTVGSKVYSGTSNIDGVIFLRATNVGEDKTVSRLVRLVSESRMYKPEIQRLADRVSAFFIPFVILLAVSSSGLWFFHSGADKALMVFLSVLLISCPCALGIATPMAIWISMGIATAHGILIKRGEILEKMSRITNVFFDKTGTITDKYPELAGSHVSNDSGIDDTRLITIVASVENDSEHPFARGILKYAQRIDYPLLDVDGFRSHPGLGVSAFVDGKTVYIGSYRFMKKSGLYITDNGLDRKKQGLEKMGKTVVYCGWDGSVKGILEISESIREDAYETVKELKDMNIGLVLLTGDEHSPSLAVGEMLDIDVRSSLAPKDKVREIKELNTEGGFTVMVGDGINDTPAMGAADVGIAMGCGTDITRESADVSFLGDELRKIPWLLRLSRHTFRKIRQNLFWAFIYNIIGLGLAVAGILQPVISALAMVLSSIFVMANSLTINRK